MEKERKGCLIMIIAIFVTATGMYAAMEYEWLYLKNLCTMLMGMTGGYVGSTYFRLAESKPIPKNHWIWHFLAIFVLAGILTWIECNYL